MLVGDTSRALVYSSPCDMRKGIESLARIVERELGYDPFAEATYVFVSRRADKIKMLRWDMNGFWLYYKKLSRGTFRWVFKAESVLFEVNLRQLSWLLDGLALEQPDAHRPVAARLLF